MADFGSDGIRIEVLSIFLDAFSSSQPVSASLENAMKNKTHRSGKPADALWEVSYDELLRQLS